MIRLIRWDILRELFPGVAPGMRWPTSLRTETLDSVVAPGRTTRHLALRPQAPQKLIREPRRRTARGAGPHRSRR